MPYLEIVVIVSIHLVSLYFAGRALLAKRDPRSALGWTAALVFMPVIGLLLYLLFGISRAESRAEKIMRREAAFDRKYFIFQACHVMPGAEGRETHVLAGLGRRLTGLALCPGNSVLGLHNGDEAYPAMLEAIDKAESHVFLSTYIFNAGEVADKFIAALTRAMRRGVDVRVLVDGYGTFYSIKKPWKLLASEGVKTARFRPLTLFPPNLGINLRSHRKVLVCDGTGFTGGLNIADGNVSCLAKKEGIKAIHDMHFRFEGPVVSQLRGAFLLNWAFCTNRYTPPPPWREAAAGDSACRVVVDGPGNDADVLDDLISGAVNIAQSHVRIMTPYFLPSDGLMAALRSAAQRGVSVWIVLPGKNNLPFMTWATMRLLPRLLAAGARVWMQPPPFAHTKLLAIDDFYCQVGSANLDTRSMKLNFELNMEIYDKKFNARIANFIDSKIPGSKEIILRDLTLERIWKRLRNAACWVFSPYL